MARQFKQRAITSVLGMAILLSITSAVKAQTVQLPPWTHQQFLSATGVPLSGACIYTDSAGTTTPLATFTDATGLTANQNPTQADAGGFVNLWLTSGVAYKFIVWSNPAGGACPGTPSGQMALQWTVDGITTAAAAGGGAATSLTSAGANPATAGVIRLAKGEQICWRNNGNSQNICLSTTTSAPVDQLTWSQGILLTEIAAPSGLAGSDLIWGDSTAHRLKQSGNGGSAAQLVNAGVDINTSDQVTSTHLSSALPVAQGGTGQTTLTGLPITNAALTTPTLTTPTSTNATFNTGVTNSGTGLQFVNTATGSVPGNGALSVTVNWPTSFADSGYQAFCTTVDSIGQLSVESIISKTAATMVVDIVSIDSLAHAASFDCLAIHP